MEDFAASYHLSIALHDMRMILYEEDESPEGESRVVTQSGLKQHSKSSQAPSDGMITRQRSVSSTSLKQLSLNNFRRNNSTVVENKGSKSLRNTILVVRGQTWALTKELTAKVQATQNKMMMKYNGFKMV